MAVEKDFLKENVVADFPVHRSGFGDEAMLYLLAGLVGLLTGVAAVIFDKLVHWIDGGLYGTSQTPGVYQGRLVFLFLLPAGGALLVGLIARFYSREAVGHGVPEVMDAIEQAERKAAHRYEIKAFEAERLRADLEADGRLFSALYYLVSEIGPEQDAFFTDWAKEILPRFT